jgi:hypothetical protein
MNWLLNIFDSIKWKIEDAVWAIQDKIKLSKELKELDAQWDVSEEVEEIEVKPKKKKAKKKSVKKAKKSV